MFTEFNVNSHEVFENLFLAVCCFVVSAVPLAMENI